MLNCSVASLYVHLKPRSMFDSLWSSHSRNEFIRLQPPIQFSKERLKPRIKQINLFLRAGHIHNGVRQIGFPSLLLLIGWPRLTTALLRLDLFPCSFAAGLERPLRSTQTEWFFHEQSRRNRKKTTGSNAAREKNNSRKVLSVLKQFNNLSMFSQAAVVVIRNRFNLLTKLGDFEHTNTKRRNAIFGRPVQPACEISVPFSSVGIEDLRKTAKSGI